MMKIPPSAWPPAQQITLPTSGPTGHVTSAIHSNATGIKLKDAAPRTADTISDAATDFDGGTQMYTR